MAGSDKKLQGFTAFNSGEYSKDLAGRTDLESFGSSTRYSVNFLSQVTGGLKKFYGTRHIAEEAVSNYHIKMIPFVNKYEPMVLVVYEADETQTDEGLRVGLIYGDKYKDLDITLPNSIIVNELRWQQMQDRLMLCHRTIQPIEIDFYGKDENGEYVFDVTQIAFKEIPYFPVGGSNDYLIPLEASGVTGEVTLTIPSGSAVILCNFPTPLAGSSIYRRTWSRSDTEVVNDSVVRLIRKRGGTTTELCSGTCNKHYYGQGPIASSDFTNRERVLQVIQTAYPDSYIYESQVWLVGVSDHQDGDSYYMVLECGSITVHGNIIYPSETYTSVAYTPTDTTTANINTSDWVGRKIKFYFNDDTEISPWYQGKTVDQGDYAYSNGHWYKVVSNGSSQQCGNIQPSHTHGIRTDGGVAWEYVHSGSKTASIIDIPSQSTIKILVKDGELPSNWDGSKNIYKNYAWSIWGKDGVHPSEIYMVGERLGFVCNTQSYGAWNAMSVAGDYFNFSTEEYGEVLDTSAIVGLIGNNESSEINWVLARKNLYMGGYSGEYFINPTGTNRRSGVYTPTETVVENISNLGGKSVVPLKYKELNMFVGITGKELYTIAYDYTTDDYTPKMMGYLTQHIMERGIKRIEALNNLDRNIYLLHDTNQLSLFNYAAEQKVLGFTELDMGDEVVDFVTTHANDEVAAYVAMKRNDGKVTFERLSIVKPNYMFDEIEQGDGENDASFVPVPHFANRTVYVRYGDDLSQFLKVTLDENGDVSHDPYSGTIMPVSKKFQVGLPMMAEMHTQPAFGNKVEGAQQQSLMFNVRMNNSGAFEYGSSVDFNQYFKFDSWPLHQAYSENHQLYTGDLTLNVPLGYAEAQNQGNGKYPNTAGVGINIRSDTPEPLGILSIEEIYR